LQTDAPLKRAIAPNGGLRMVQNSLDAYNYKMDPKIAEIYSSYRKTHNQGVFDVYSPEIRACRKSHVITGLPDAYGRGRIIGDYRRIALYGVNFLIQQKQKEKDELNDVEFTEEVIRLREELSEQLNALGELVQMAKNYGFDVSRPAETAQEAVQWTYFGYLATVKEQNGAAMSFGRTSTFLDIYIARDLAEGKITEAKPRNSSTISSSSCAWCASSARRNTTPCSAATRRG
jgi:Pyruvate-formate lyase